MKKKLLAVSMVMAVAVMLSACGGADVTKTASTQQPPANSLLEKAASVQEEAAQEEAQEETGVKGAETVSLALTPEEPDESVATDDDVDLDLTKLSKTMVYSEVYNIMVNPDDYIGKTIRMNGDYNTFTDTITGMQYYYCVIQDATACCAQGIEFVLTDDYKYPDDYPDEGENVTVVGRFDTYLEDEYLYCTLRDAVLEN